MVTLDQLQQLYGGRSAEDTISLAAKDLGFDPVHVANEIGYDAGKGSISGERWSSAIDNYQSGMYETLGLGARALGARGVSDWATRNAADNRFQANVASQRAQQYGGVQSWDDVHGASDLGSYVLGQGINAAPYLAEAAVGGLAGRAVSGAAGLVRGAEAGLQTAARGGNAAEIARATEALNTARTSASQASSAGVVAGAYPSSVGDILGNMREQNGQTDDGYAAIGGLAYAGLNALPGLEGAVGGGRINMLSRGTMDAAEGFRGGLKRAGMAGLTTGASEALNETGQEFINQGGRVSVDPRAEMFSDEALQRYKESAIGGGLLGGIFGGVGNRGQRSQKFYEDGRTQNLIANGSAEREEGLRNMVGPRPELVGPENGLYLNQYGQDEGPMYGQEPVEPQQPTALDPNQYDMFNPDGSPTYGAASSTPMLDVDATREQLNAPGAPAQDVINQTLGIGQRRYAGGGYPKQFEAAASAPTGQNLARASNDQLESPVTALEEIQRQAGVLHPAVQAAAQQQMAVKQTAEQQQKTAEWARTTFGLASADGAPAGELFGQPVFGASRLREVALALGEAASGLTDTQVALTNAIVKGGKLAAQPVKFAFKPDMVPQSVNKALEAVNKVAQTLQIDHVQTPAEAAAILNELSKTANGRQLELIDAVHSALTGKSTEGFDASQQPEQKAETKPAQAQTAPAPVATTAVAEKPKFQRAPKPTAVATIDPAKTVTVGKSGRKKEVTAVELRQKMASASDDVKLRLQLAMGYTPTKNPDTGANMMVPGDSPRTFEEVGQMLGVSKQAVAQSLAGIGVDEQVINRAVSNNAPTVSEAELGLVAEDGVSAEAAAGMRVSDTAAQATGMGLVEGGTMTPEQKKAEVEANRILKTAPPPVEVLDAGQETAREAEARMEREAQERIDVNVREALASPEANNSKLDWNADNVAFDELPDRLKADWIVEYEMMVREYGADFSPEAWSKLEAIQTVIERDYYGYLDSQKTNATKAELPRVQVADRQDQSGPGAVKKLEAPAAQKPDAPGRQAAEVIKTDRELAAEAWDAVALTLEDAPTFDTLSEETQDTFVGYGQGNRERADVVREMQHMSSANKAPGVFAKSGRSVPVSISARPSEAEIEDVAQRLVGSFAHQPRIVIRDSAVGTIPGDVQPGVASGAVHKGAIYLFRDGLASQAEVARTLFHELFHYGLRRLMSKEQFTAKMLELYQRDAYLKSEADNWVKTPDGVKAEAFGGKQFALARGVDEALAVMAEPNGGVYIKNGVMDRVLRTVQRWMASLAQALGAHKLAADIRGMKNQGARDYIQSILASLRDGQDTGKTGWSDEADTAYSKPVTMQSVVRDVPTAATELMDYLKMGRDAVAIRGMFTEDLVNLAARVLPAAKGYLSAMKAIQAKRGAAERSVEAVLNQFRALSSVEQSTGPASVNAFIKESTFDNKWAFMPDWLPKGSVKVDADLAARFDSMLSDKAQEVVKAVFKHGYTSLQEMKKAALDAHESEYDVLIAEATKAGDKAEVGTWTRKKEKSMKDFQSLFAIHEFTPYAPLKRFGNYVVLAVSAQYKAAHEAGNTKAMQEMQSDGAHYHVEFAETPRAAKKLVALLAPKFPDGFVGKMEKADDSVMMGGRDMLGAFGRLRKTIKENTDDELMGIDRKTAARMDDMMRQMYLTLLSEASARKSELHRKNIAGADGDMMKAFATQGRATAHFIAGLQTSGQVDDHLASMREQTRKLDDPALREQRQKYLNEILRRHSMGLEYHPSPIIDKLMSTSSVMMLLTNPAYHVMNALQPGLMTQPLLAARHGYYKSWVELKRAYTDLAPILKSAKFDESSYAKLPEDVREAINDLANRGVIDIMMDADLGRFESEPDSALRGIATVNEKLRHIAQNVEAMNRLSSAIAAYRLEKTKDRATHQSAVDYAAKVIYESHGDYSGFNAPRFMRNDIGRVLTQFRKFQLIQLSLVTREFHRAFFGKGTDTQTEQEVKTAGRYALAYTLAHLFATAGVMGLPGAAAIGWALGKMTPDDEPDDPEATLRRFIGNKFAADLLVKGAPKALGIDLSRTGAGNMVSLFPYTDIDVSREGYPKLLMAATGPFFGGLLPKMADGLTQMASGNMMKGTEALMPTLGSNLLRSARFASEGITKANGDVTMSADDIGTLDVLAQAFGLPTNKVTDKSFLSSSQYNAEQFYKDKSSELKQRYSKAAKTNDSDTMRSLREEWTRVQATSKEVGIQPQPLQNLLKAPAEQRKREQGVQYGVAYTKKTAGYAPTLME